MKQACDSDVLVIGAGVVGLMCAVRLTAAGHSVILLDRGQTQGVASYGNAGHVATEQIYPLASPRTLVQAAGYLFENQAPLSIRPAYAPHLLPWLARFAWAARPRAFQRGMRALASLQASAIADLKNGLVLADAEHLLREHGHYLVSDLPDRRSLDRQIRRERRDGVPIDEVSPGHLDALSLAGGRPPLSAWHYPGSAQIRSPEALLDALRQALPAGPGTIVTETVTALEKTATGLICHCRSGNALKARTIVLAAGPGAPPLLETFGVRAPLETEGGYHLHLPNWQMQVDAPIIDARRKIILSPMVDGTRVSGFVEFAGWNAAPDPRRFAQLERHVRSLAPHADLTGTRRWHGFRPSMPDHLPVLGPVPGVPGLICAFGHQHLGLTLSGVTARLISDVVAGRPDTAALHPFRPDRFGHRNRVF